jgi:hypothetical protein
VDLGIKEATAPLVFSVDGYRLLVMPMVLKESKPESKAVTEAEEAEAIAEDTKVVGEEEAEAVAEDTEDKPKRKRKVKEPVAVA